MILSLQNRKKIILKTWRVRMISQNRRKNANERPERKVSFFWYFHTLHLVLGREGTEDHNAIKDWWQGSKGARSIREETIPLAKEQVYQKRVQKMLFPVGDSSNGSNGSELKGPKRRKIPKKKKVPKNKDLHEKIGLCRCFGFVSWDNVRVTSEWKPPFTNRSWNHRISTPTQTIRYSNQPISLD